MSHRKTDENVVSLFADPIRCVGFDNRRNPFEYANSAIALTNFQTGSDDFQRYLMLQIFCRYRPMVVIIQISHVRVRLNRPKAG